MAGPRGSGTGIDPVGFCRTDVDGRGQVAQLVEHATENRGVGGSIPPLAMKHDRSVAQLGRAPVSKTGGWGFESLRACVTETRPHRLTVRTPLFQGGDRGSIPREGIGRGWLPAGQENWGCSSVWLECRSVTPEAAGSSPVSPAGGYLKIRVVERVSRRSRGKRSRSKDGRRQRCGIAGSRSQLSSPWTNPREHRERRSAGLARRSEGGIASLFARGATQSEALERNNVYYT